jgi:hypothetical protein
MRDCVGENPSPELSAKSIKVTRDAALTATIIVAIMALVIDRPAIAPSYSALTVGHER